MSGFNLDEYVDVAERIQLFRMKHPEGSLQAELVGSPDGFIAMRAYAYRSPEDPRPGVGHAWEPLPGRTPYTKDSELMVCETSAWGRAIVAALAADTKKGVASANEVAARADKAPVHAGAQQGVADAGSADTGSAEKSGGVGALGEAVSAPSGTTPKGHKRGCTFPSASEFRKDGTTPLPEGKLRCTGCDAVLKESEVA